MYKLNFTLKQHTPLIHFLDKQDGATLRATEVKPKLDLYLKNVAYCDEEAVYSEFLQKVRQKICAFNYKLTIKAIGNAEKYLFSSQKLKENQISFWKNKNVIAVGETPFFANEKGLKDGIEDEIRFAVLYKEGVELIFSSVHKKLLDDIDKNLDHFLLLNNFGTRANKGFGSFTRKNFISSTSISEVEQNMIHGIFYENFYDHLFLINLQAPNNSIGGLLKTINDSYKKLKGGINGESKINNYYKSKEIGDENVVWEKEVLKWQIIKKTENKADYEAKEHERYVRVLLGLAELYDYDQLKIKIKIKCLNSAIERFASPLYFKVINNCIYLTTKKIPDNIYNQKFEFSSGEKKVTILSPPKNLKLDLAKFLGATLERSWRRIDLQKTFGNV